jgi:hydroxyacylglutathione hydrolase
VVHTIWQAFRDTQLGCSSFLLGDENAGVGMVVDALGVLGPDTYILAAQEAGLQIRWVVETHVHADHASAAEALAQAVGVPVTLSHRAEPKFPANFVQDGMVMAVGGLEVTVWETPGHTPDSISLVVRDLTRSAEPWLVMTGDSLFVGDVGRPDLADPDPVMVRTASADQFRSIRRLMSLPDFTEVHPAHYGASPCGGLFMSRKPESTIGYERRANRFLEFQDVERFAEYQLALLKPPPAEAARLRRQNLGEPVEAPPASEEVNLPGFAAWSSIRKELS